MKCPYRINELHTCHDGKTYAYKEFAECYQEACPYWGYVEYTPDGETAGGCRKAEMEC